MTNLDIVGTGRRVRKLVGFVGLALILPAYWLASMAIDIGTAACPAGVPISDINHGAGGPECGTSMLYWLFAVVSFGASAWAISAWFVIWIMGVLTVAKQ